MLSNQSWPPLVEINSPAPHPIHSPSKSAANSSPSTRVISSARPSPILSLTALRISLPPTLPKKEWVISIAGVWVIRFWKGSLPFVLKDDHPSVLVDLIRPTNISSSVLASFHYGNLTNPSQDAPRIGFLSTVPADAGDILQADVSSASAMGHNFPGLYHLLDTCLSTVFSQNIGNL